jgi:hypothetical protein
MATALTASVNPSAPVPRPMPQGAPIKTLLSIGKNALEMILSIADDVRASRTCRQFRRATEELIKRQWSPIRLEHFSHLQGLLAQNPPTNCRELSAAVRAMQGSYPHMTEALKTIRPSFAPRVFEDSIQRESDKNLALIWPRIAQALQIPLLPGTCDQIRASLRENEAQLATITELDLSGLGLTMIPDEIASLDLPNVTSLNLSENRLRALPNNFGVNWNQLESLCLNRNQLTALPNNFGANWNQLEDLMLGHNALRALPNNFGANWNQLTYLDLNRNQLTALPDNFGATWHLLTQQRTEVLSRNPILDPIPSQSNGMRRRLPQEPQPLAPSSQNTPQMSPAANGLPQNSILDPIPSAPHLEKHSTALINARFANFAATVALVAVATYAIGLELPSAIGALYLGRQYMKGDLWAV